MIQSKLLYECQCNSCGEKYSDNKWEEATLFDSRREAREEIAKVNTWCTTGTDEHYCPHCWSLNDDGTVNLDIDHT